MEKWFIRNRKANYALIASQFGISEVTARIAVNRGISSNAEMRMYLHPSLGDLHEPRKMKHMELASEIIREKIKAGKKIRIIGDYDVDGVMSTYILYTGLKYCGANVDYEIPDRIKDGYGINIAIVEAAAQEGVDTILTCDNGIAAFDQIARAKELGLTVVITDHHDIPFHEENGKKQYRIPLADAIVNPKQHDCLYPMEGICGAVVAFKLIQVLYENLGIKAEKAGELLEFAAIATVCDVMDLVDENRTIVQYGLKKAERTKNIGLQALLRENKLEDQHLSAYHFGFVVGPCINASGRLESAKLALRLFLTDNEKVAQEYAKDLKELNEERKELTSEGIEKACELVEKQYMEDSVLVVYLEHCHESIAGIIAGRIRERYNKPAIVLTDGEEHVKGSGRSIEEYPMSDKLNECKELLLKFGGHPLAAGLSLKKENIEPLRRALNEKSGLKEEDFIKKVSFDMVLPFEDVTCTLIQEFDLLEPFGKSNEKPSFALKDVQLVNAKVIGKNKNMARLTVKTRSSNQVYTAMLFREFEAFEQLICEKYGEESLKRLYEGTAENVLLDFVFYPNVNEFNGNTTIQFIIQHFR
ncbi:single-stranded-DNA-specific exonuclease RecJ [[Clostridium] polysaccharolyticum]|uniref:Single-stranded-DNA-specific exonuclease RecJ n=1 Tax=[Clostridium] polysaccharolyticum TaxID=29364 RepID=A0A1I0DP90_9FIRM|nr:single-stranded-DNA-specific exonuclease RecJ [[Clostridium] polysaccharolyticum]SET33536.1 single-stranded-DNA-specific exonuclease [[Clostridium] polysaccharolyticum]